MIDENKPFRFSELIFLWIPKLVFLLILFTQCSPSNQPDTNYTNNEINKVTDKVYDSLRIVLFQPPIVINSNTCPKPKIIAVPKEGSHLNEFIDGSNILKLEPPQTVLASFNSFMQNYNTEQGLALSSISEGSRSSICDRQGNLWFGTQGGGVSRFDGKSFTNFTMDQGLAGNLVQSIAEDSMGNIWFGTDGSGASKYDGRVFTNYTSKQGLASDVINSIIEDTSGKLWFATTGGLSCFNGESFVNFSISQGLADNIVYCIYEDNIGTLWFGTRKGVSKFDGNSFVNLNVTQGLVGNFINCISQDKNGNLWFGTWGKGVSCYNGKEFINFTTAEGLAGNYVSNIKVDKAGTLWFATSDGVSSCDPLNVVKLEGVIFKNFTTAQGLSNNSVNSITEDKIGNLWFGTNGGGISRYAGSAFINFSESQGLSNSLIFSITEDTRGNLWFGTYENGVCCYNGKSFTYFNTKQGLIENAVNCICEDEFSNLWFGTNEGVSCYNGKTFTNFTEGQGLVNNVVNSIILDSKGIMWYGTVNGVSCFDGKTFTNFSTDQGLVNNRVYTIREDESGKIWIGTDGGVSCFNPSIIPNEGANIFTNFTVEHGLIDNRVYSITQDSARNIWFGTYKGVSRYDGNSHPAEKASFMSFTTTQGLADNSVMAVSQDQNGVIWMGTNKGFSGLYFQKATNSMDIEQGARDERNKKKIIPAGLLDVSNQELKTYKPVWEIYNNQTGYPVKDVNGGSNNGAMICDSKGIIWAGTGDVNTGLVRFDVNTVLKSPEAPVVIIKSIKVNNERICWYNLKYLRPFDEITIDSLTLINEEYLTFGKTLTDVERNTMRQKFSGLKFDTITPFYPLPQNLALPYAQNNITFEFNAVITSQNFRVKYQYILEGYDENWSPETDQSIANFGNIFEGTYTFKVKACSPDGIWSEPISYIFEVLPPWWRVWWMYGIYIVVFICLIYLVFRWQISKLKREKQVLEDKVSMRTAELYQANEEITAQRDDIEAQRDEIEAQRDIVTLQKEQIEEVHKKVSDSINYAKRIQQAVLPSENYAEGILSDHFILFKPKDVVSGDFYWATKINEWLIFTVADCTGHGVPGAFMSMLGISFLNEIVRKKEVVTASEVLEQLRTSIIEALHQTSDVDKQKDGIDISLCILNLNTLELQFSGANNPVYIASSELKELKVIKGDKMTLAISHKMKPFTNHIIQTQKGDIVYLVSDGYQDQFGGPDDWKFTSKKLEKLLFENHDKPMYEQKKILTKTIEDWMYYGNGINFEQIDDITIMGIKI